MTHPDYLEALRERYGPDAGRDADDQPGCTLRAAACCYCTGRAGCRAADAEDDLDADDYDPDYDLDLCGPDGPTRSTTTGDGVPS